MKLTNVFLIFVQFTLYFTNKSHKNMLQKLVHFVQTGELFFNRFVHCSQCINPHVALWWKSPDDERQMIGLIQLQTQNWTKTVWLSLKCLSYLIEHSILRMKMSVLLTGFLIFYLRWLREFDPARGFTKTMKSRLSLAGHLIRYTTVLIKWFHDLNSAKWLLQSANKILLSLCILEWLLSHGLNWSPLCKTLGESLFLLISVKHRLQTANRRPALKYRLRDKMQIPDHRPLKYT